MKLLLAFCLLVGLASVLVGCASSDTVSWSQQQSKKEALQKIADSDTTHARDPSRDR